ncbi:MAG: aldehyde ferredoxin oxidoreductase C-terminal domain-containing protein [Candidatus Baldrarchaeia archaeon]
MGNEDAVFRLIELIAYRKGIGNLLAEGGIQTCKEI